jgi:hypothetical protein
VVQRNPTAYNHTHPVAFLAMPAGRPLSTLPCTLSFLLLGILGFSTTWQLAFGLTVQSKDRGEYHLVWRIAALERKDSQKDKRNLQLLSQCHPGLMAVSLNLGLDMVSFPPPLGSWYSPLEAQKRLLQHVHSVTHLMALNEPGSTSTGTCWWRNSLLFPCFAT